MIRPATPADASSIADIYNYYIENTVITFEEVPVATTEMARRMAGTPPPFPWLVCEDDGRIQGYAYAIQWQTRSAYRHAAHASVYFSPEHTGQGLGTRLYRELLDRLRNGGIHTAIGGIALPNPASIAMSEKLGFSKVAHFKQVGWKHERWVDVGYWQRML